MSCSELSEIEAQNEIRAEVEDQNRKLEEELKDGVPSDILEIEQYDEEGNYQTKIIRIDEENKNVAAEWVLPPIISKLNNISDDNYMKGSPSKVTTFFEEPRDFMTRKDSYEAGYSSLTQKPKNILNNHESNRSASTKDFVFTSSHIKMIDKSNICEEKEDDYLKHIVKNKENLSNRLKKLITNNGGSVRWVTWENNEDEEEEDNEVRSENSIKKYQEPEVFLQKSGSFRIRENSANSPSRIHRNSIKKRLSNLEKAHSTTTQKNLKDFKYTSQVEWNEINGSPISDNIKYRSNRQ